MTSAQFVHAIAMTESTDNPETWGDHGHAVGRYQVHPDWLWGWAVKLALAPLLNESWDNFIARVVARFFVWHQDELKPVEIAMKFHLGHESHEASKDWDKPYATRFLKYAGG